MDNRICLGNFMNICKVTVKGSTYIENPNLHDEFSKSFMKTWSETCLKTYIRIWFAHLINFTSVFKHLIKNKKKSKRSKKRKFPVSSTLCFSRPCLFFFFFGFTLS